MRVFRTRVAALLACLMIAPVTFAATHVGAAEMVEQWGEDWGDPGAGFFFDPASPDRDCADFATGAEAQGHFESYGRPHRDPHGLDRDGDLIACEGFPY